MTSTLPGLTGPTAGLTGPYWGSKSSFTTIQPPALYHSITKPLIVQQRSYSNYFLKFMTDFITLSVFVGTFAHVPLMAEPIVAGSMVAGTVVAGSMVARLRVAVLMVALTHTQWPIAIHSGS